MKDLEELKNSILESEKEINSYIRIYLENFKKTYTPRGKVLNFLNQAFKTKPLELLQNVLEVPVSQIHCEEASTKFPILQEKFKLLKENLDYVENYCNDIEYSDNVELANIIDLIKHSRQLYETIKIITTNFQERLLRKLDIIDSKTLQKTLHQKILHYKIPLRLETTCLQAQLSTSPRTAREKFLEVYNQEFQTYNEIITNFRMVDDQIHAMSQIEVMTEASCGNGNSIPQVATFLILSDVLGQRSELDSEFVYSESAETESLIIQTLTRFKTIKSGISDSHEELPYDLAQPPQFQFNVETLLLKEQRISEIMENIKSTHDEFQKEPNPENVTKLTYLSEILKPLLAEATTLFGQYILDYPNQSKLLKATLDLAEPLLININIDLVTFEKKQLLTTSIQKEFLKQRSYAIERLKIPIFTQKTDYAVWIENFMDIVQEYPDSVMKLRALRQACKHEQALKIIQHSKDFDEAINDLSRVFNHARVVVPTIMRNLSALKPAGHNRAIETDNVMSILNHLKHLNNLGLEGQSQISPLLVDSLAPKLREISYENWERKVEEMGLEQDPERKIEAFKQHLNFVQVTNCRMDTTRSLFKSPPAVEPPKNVKTNQLDLQTKPNVPATSKPECYFCKGEHTIYYCPNLEPNLLGPNTLDLIKKKGICIRCLKRWENGHTCSGTYTVKNKQNQLVKKKSDCEKHKNIHFKICPCAAKRNPSNHSNIISCQTNESLLYNKTPLGQTVRPIECIPLVNKKGIIKNVKILYDTGTGSTLAIPEATKNFAYSVKDLNQEYYLETATSSEIVQAKRAIFKIKSENNSDNFFEAVLSVDRPKITENIVNLSIPANWQNKYGLSKNICISDSDPKIILGVDLFTQYFPQIIESVGNLVLAFSQITHNYIVFGNNSNNTQIPGLLSNAATSYLDEGTQGSSLPSHLQVDKPGSVQVQLVGEFDHSAEVNITNNCPLHTTKGRIINQTDTSRIVKYIYDKREDRDFVSSQDILDVLDYSPPRCSSCSNCKACTFTGKLQTVSDLREYKLIFDDLIFNPTIARWETSYHYSENLKHLENNEAAALARFNSLERTLHKLGPTAIAGLNERILEGIKKGFYISLNEALKIAPEIKNMQSHFTPGNVVIAPLKSTPFRHTMDPSMAGKNGLTLNDTELKGPNQIPLIYDMLVKMRAYKEISLGDISQMYHQVWLSPRDWSLHRFHYREKGYCSSEPIEVYLCRSSTFGDVEAVPTACIALEKTIVTFCKLEENIKRSIHSSYIDDLFVHSQDRQKMLDHRQDLEQALGKASYKIKQWISNGEGSKNTAVNLTSDSALLTSEGALGLKWFPLEDELSITSKVNFSKKVRNLRSGPNLNKEDIAKYLEEKNFTKRAALASIHVTWDPLGFFGPLIFWGKTLYRHLLQTYPGMSWDDKVPDIELASWQPFLENLTQTSLIRFPRAMIPKQPLKQENPILVTFFDASYLGSGIVTYLRWELEGARGNYQVYLVTSRSKVAALKKFTIPKAEFLALHLAARSTHNLKKLLPFEISRLYVIGDSQIALQQARKSPSLLDNTLSIKCEEIQNLLNVETDLYFTRSQHNPADLNTRAMNGIEQIDSPFWLTGDFLMKDQTDWPISKPGDLPEVVSGSSLLSAGCGSQPSSHLLISSHAVEETPVNLCDSDLEEPFSHLLMRHRDVNKSIRILTYCLYFKTLALRQDTSFEEVKARVVENLEIQASQASRQLLKKIRVDSEIMEDQGRLYLVSRYLQDFGRRRILFLSPHSYLGKAILVHMHDSNHFMSPRRQNAKLNQKVFIPRATQHLTTIAGKCQTCKKILGKRMEQILGGLPRERFQVTPPFQNSMVDVSGPFLVYTGMHTMNTRKGQVKTIKAYCLHVVCMATRSIFLTALQSLSSDHFIMALLRLTSRHGQLKSLFMDLGSNFQGASNQQQDAVDAEDDINLSDGELQSLQKDLGAWGKSQAVTFNFASAHAHHQSGLVEIQVKELKKLLKVFKFPSKKLDLLDFESLLSAAAAHLNGRPLSLNVGAGQFICPNDLLHFNAAREGNFQAYQLNNTNLTTMSFQAKILLEKFQENFMDIWKNKIIRIRKWRNLRQNLEIGDVVLVLDHQRLQKGRFGLGLVHKVHLDDEKIARNFTIKYKVPGGRHFKFTKRHISSLSLILEKDQIINSDKVFNLEDVLLVPEPTYLPLSNLPDGEQDDMSEEIEELAIPDPDEVPDLVNDEDDSDDLDNQAGPSTSTQDIAEAPDNDDDIDLAEVDADLDAQEVDRVLKTLDRLDSQSINQSFIRKPVYTSILVLLSIFSLTTSAATIPYNLCRPTINAEPLLLNFAKLGYTLRMLRKFQKPVLQDHVIIQGNLVGLLTPNESSLATPISLSTTCTREGGTSWVFTKDTILEFYYALNEKPLSIFVPIRINAFNTLSFAGSTMKLPKDLQDCMASRVDSTEERLAWDNRGMLVVLGWANMSSGCDGIHPDRENSWIGYLCHFGPTAEKTKKILNYQIMEKINISHLWTEYNLLGTQVNKLTDLIFKAGEESNCLPVEYRLWSVFHLPKKIALNMETDQFGLVLQNITDSLIHLQYSVGKAMLALSAGELQTSHLTLGDHIHNFEAGRDTEMLLIGTLTSLFLLLLGLAGTLKYYGRKHPVTIQMQERSRHRRASPSIAEHQRLFNPNQLIRVNKMA